MKIEKDSEESVLKNAFQQFLLESERVEFSYQNLEKHFHGIQRSIQESQTKLGGKLAELDFLTRYLEAILNHISQGIIFINLNGIVTTCNFAAEEILGLKIEKCLYHPFTDFFNDASFGFSLEEALKTKKSPPSSFVSWTSLNGKSYELEIESTFVQMGGDAVPLDHRQSSISIGPVQGLLLLIRNVTEVRYLQELANRNDRLKELGEMAAHLAHEIRNPLGGMKGFATLLVQDLSERPELKQMAASIVEGAETLNHLVSSILTYARPFQPHFEAVDLVAYINEIRLLLQADAAWNSSFAFHLNSGGDELQVAIDPQLLKSALLNLFVNAMQAMPSGGTITVAIERDCNHVIITISDTGKGISTENLTKIFSPFFTTKETGTGLGLSEVQKVIHAHLGTIIVHSELGKGSVFTIKLPLKNGMRSREYVH
ncbi:MAG: PAS domain-containing protein [Candidatus Protochlamydia sp.]|nr:PAS domain-containing protein [Candidatus Protochlamydia sp.]